MEEIGGIVELPDGRTVNKSDLRQTIKDKELQISLLQMDVKQARQDLMYLLEQEGQIICGCGLFTITRTCDNCKRKGCDKCIRRTGLGYTCDGIC